MWAESRLFFFFFLSFFLACNLGDISEMMQDSFLNILQLLKMIWYFLHLCFISCRKKKYYFWKLSEGFPCSILYVLFFLGLWKILSEWFFYIVCFFYITTCLWEHKNTSLELNLYVNLYGSDPLYVEVNCIRRNPEIMLWKDKNDYL